MEQGQGIAIIKAVEHHDEEQERKALLMRIGQRCLELTANPQMDIEPGDLLKQTPDGGFDHSEYTRQIDNPRLSQGKEIHGAVHLFRKGAGQTTFIIVRGKEGNQASVRVNEGMTATGDLTSQVEVGPQHKELVVDTIRKEVVSPGTMGIGRQEQYYAEQIVIGGVPGTGTDSRVTRALQVQENRKRFAWMKDNFATNRALSDMLPQTDHGGGTNGELQVKDLQAILGILETGKIDAKGMMQAIVKKARFAYLNPGASGATI